MDSKQKREPSGALGTIINEQIATDQKQDSTSGAVGCDPLARVDHLVARPRGERISCQRGGLINGRCSSIYLGGDRPGPAASHAHAFNNGPVPGRDCVYGPRAVGRRLVKEADGVRSTRQRARLGQRPSRSPYGDARPYGVGASAMRERSVRCNPRRLLASWARLSISYAK